MKPLASHGGGTGRQGGIALVLVLWVITLMTVIALSVSNLSRTEMHLARNRVDEARIRALADAAVNHVMLRLSSTEPEDHWLPDGSPHPWAFAGNDLEVRVFNESSRVGLNTASDIILGKLFGAVGVEDARVEELVATLLDWRDADDSTRPLGAESADYRAAGRPYGSKNGQFHSVDELGQVLGVSPQVLAQLAPVLSVNSASRNVLLEYADPMLQAILGEDEQTQQPVRGRQGDADGDRDPDLESEQQRGHNIGGPLYRIKVAMAGGGPGMETLVQRGGIAGVQVLWRRLDWRPVATLPEPSE